MFKRRTRIIAINYVNYIRLRTTKW